MRTFDNILLSCALSDQTLEVPTDDDMKGAAAALLRLQRTYLINTQDLAEGKVMSSVNRNQMCLGSHKWQSLQVNKCHCGVILMKQFCW